MSSCASKVASPRTSGRPASTCGPMRVPTGSAAQPRRARCRRSPPATAIPAAARAGPEERRTSCSVFSVMPARCRACLDDARQHAAPAPPRVSRSRCSCSDEAAATIAASGVRRSCDTAARKVLCSCWRCRPAWARRCASAERSRHRPCASTLASAAACSRPTSSAAGAGSMRTAPMTWPARAKRQDPGVDARPAAGARPDHRRLVDGAAQRLPHRLRQAVDRRAARLGHRSVTSTTRSKALRRARPPAATASASFVGVEQLGRQRAQLARAALAFGGEPRLGSDLGPESQLTSSATPSIAASAIRCSWFSTASV